jgi:hypothetical protein
MRIYLAGLYTASFNIGGKKYNDLSEKEKADRRGAEWKLESYHYVHRQSYVDKMRNDGVKIFLDSGAFSAFTQGATIDIAGYCNYIKENADIIQVEDGAVMASVLDSIGDAQGTYDNQKTMEGLGVRPLPCFHYGEDPKFLEYYVANYSYITLGGMVAQSTKDLLIWLDEMWEKYLTDGSGRPKTKVHAFGVTTPLLMKRYPWFSVDSSSWVQVSANGSILFNGKALAISDQSPSRKVHNQHYNTISPPMQAAVLKQLTEEGYCVERLATEYASRWVYNVFAFGEMHKTFPPYEDARWVQDQMGLF